MAYDHAHRLRDEVEVLRQWQHDGYLEELRRFRVDDHSTVRYACDPPCIAVKIRLHTADRLFEPGCPPGARSTSVLCSRPPMLLHACRPVRYAPLSLHKPMTALVAHMVLSVLTRQAALPSDVPTKPERSAVACLNRGRVPVTSTHCPVLPMNGPFRLIFFLLPHLVASVL